MAKFYQYINEIPVSQETKDAWEVLSRDCKEIIDFYKKSSVVSNRIGLFRGTKRDISVISEKIRPRKDRKPKDTPKKLQQKFDKEFNKAFGWKPRSSGVFTFGNNKVSGYGRRIYSVFPADGWSFLWSPEIPDLFLTLKPDGIINSSLEITDYYKENPQKLISYAREKVSTYTNSNLEKAMSSGKEIIINCDYYYLVAQNTWEGILNNYIKG